LTAPEGERAGVALTASQKIRTVLDFRSREESAGMQRARATQVFSRDLREAISDLKKDGYRRALEEAHDQVALSLIERGIRSDYQLGRDDRLQLLAQVELASHDRGDCGRYEGTWKANSVLTGL